MEELRLLIDFSESKNLAAPVEREALTREIVEKLREILNRRDVGLTVISPSLPHENIANNAKLSDWASVDNALAKEEKQIEELLSKLLACSREDKRLAVYRLLNSLLGDQFDDEVVIYDLDDSAYGYLLSPAKRLALQLLEDPELAKDLEEQADSHEDTVPIKEVIESLKTK